MIVRTSAVAEFKQHRDELFTRACDPAVIARAVRPLGPLPGVDRAWVIGGGETRLGTIRRVVLTDGTPLDETVTEWEPPRVHGYRIKGFRFPLGSLVTHIDSRWVFSPLGDGTRVTWTYEVNVKNALALPIVVALTKGPLQRFLAASLERLRTL